MATCLPSRKLYKLDEPDMQNTAGEARMNSSVMYSYGPLHMAKQKQNDQLEHTYSSYVRIRDVTLKTCQKRWMIGRSGERGSGISVLVAQHDDHDICIYIHTHTHTHVLIDTHTHTHTYIMLFFLLVQQEKSIYDKINKWIWYFRFLFGLTLLNTCFWPHNYLQENTCIYIYIYIYRERERESER